MKLLLNKLLDK